MGYTCYTTASNLLPFQSPPIAKIKATRAGKISLEQIGKTPIGPSSRRMTNMMTNFPKKTFQACAAVRGGAAFRPSRGHLRGLRAAWPIGWRLPDRALAFTGLRGPEAACEGRRTCTPPPSSDCVIGDALVSMNRGFDGSTLEDTVCFRFLFFFAAVVKAGLSRPDGVPHRGNCKPFAAEDDVS